MKPLKTRLDAAQVGLEMGGCVLAGYLLGSWLDGQLDTAPGFLYFFLACGIAAGFMGFWRVVKRYRHELNVQKAGETRP